MLLTLWQDQVKIVILLINKLNVTKMKKIKLKLISAAVLFATVFSILAHSNTRYLSGMDITVIRSEQNSESSGGASIGSDGVSGSGSTSSSGSGAVIGVLFECSFALSSCETDDQKYVGIDGDPITITLH